MGLPNPDDAVATSLNPTEDYKTSVLSGLPPSTIMECAGRGLSFWSYQSTQEIVYQEYLAKTLTDKHHIMKHEIDQVVSHANAEIDGLNNKIQNMAIDEERLKTDNQTLITNLRERTRKHQQTQELYDRLKRKQMTTATQHAAKNAAFESVEETYGSDSSGRRPYNGRPLHQPTMQHYSPHHEANPTQSRDESSNREHEIPGMMPPPIPQRSGIHVGNVPTPSRHRTQLGPFGQTNNHIGAPGQRNVPSIQVSSQISPMHRQPLNSISPNRAALNGYGMSAGLKVGRQQNSRLASMNQSAQGRENERPFSSQYGQQAYHGSNTYF